MTGYVTSPCCGRSLPASDEDIGETFACPQCHKSVAVTRSNFQLDGLPITPSVAAKPADRPFWLRVSRKQLATGVCVAVVVCLAAGFLTGLANRKASPRLETQVAAVAAEPEPVTVQATPLPTPIAPDLPAPVATVRIVEVAPMPAVVVVASPEPPATTPVAALVAIDPKPATPAAKPASNVDRHGFTIHTVAKRLDHRKADDLQKDMLAARELTLDAPGSNKMSSNLVQLAKTHQGKGTYPGTVAVLRWKPELANLPFQSGTEATLNRDRAQAMDSLSRQLREAIQTTIQPGIDPRPDTDALHATLISTKREDLADNRRAAIRQNRKVWATQEAVPCIVQMLQPENREIRRMSCELLRGFNDDEATEALVKWAVFDTDPGNRAAAVDALRERDRSEVSRLLTSYLRYPWARAVEHACEAIVALNCQEAIPQLAAAFDQPDPDAPFQLSLPGVGKSTYRREVVRVNHLSNCITCHAPSLQRTDLIRGAVPDPTKPVPPSSTPAYYDQPSALVVTASVTYLRQDFSLFQPVANPGKWPEHQRFDYFVAVQRDTTAPATKPSADSPYRRAVGFALKELSGQDPVTHPDWVAQQRQEVAGVSNSVLGQVARVACLQINPAALTAVKSPEIERLLSGVPNPDFTTKVWMLLTVHGSSATRLALIAHFDPQTRSSDSLTREKANRMLAVAMGTTPDADFPAALRNAARGPQSE